MKIWDFLLCAENSTNLGIGRFYYVRVLAVILALNNSALHTTDL